MPSFEISRTAVASVALLILLPILLIASTGLFIHLFKKDATQSLRKRKRSIVNAADARHILKESPLMSRALSNQNIASAFHVENSFTTADKNVHLLFLRRVYRLINISPKQWEIIAQDALLAVETFLRGDEEDVEELVQASTLLIILSLLFPRNRLPKTEWKSAISSLGWIAKEINAIWISSKSGLKLEEDLDHLARLQDLRQEILRLTPGYEGEDQLALLLPAFETIWRVIVRGFLEVFQASQFRARDFQETLLEFLESPTTKVFDKTNPKTGFSPRSIVFEVLRLYPPTRRIYRYDTDHEVTSMINVEEIQREWSIWNRTTQFVVAREAQEFLPERWLQDVTPDMNQHFLPFGSGPHRCPASAHFAPHLIAILLGALSKITKEKSYTLPALTYRTPLSNTRLQSLNFTLTKTKSQALLAPASQARPSHSQ